MNVPSFPVRLYRPSSGSEGIDFQSAWCGECKHDKLWNGEAVDPDRVSQDDMCQIIGRSMAHSIDEPGYPQEWVRAQDGRPMCLAFERKGTPYRCLLTVDMFTGRTIL